MSAVPISYVIEVDVSAVSPLVFTDNFAIPSNRALKVVAWSIFNELLYLFLTFPNVIYDFILFF